MHDRRSPVLPISLFIFALAFVVLAFGVYYQSTAPASIIEKSIVTERVVTVDRPVITEKIMTVEVEKVITIDKVIKVDKVIVVEKPVKVIVEKTVEKVVMKPYPPDLVEAMREANRRLAKWSFVNPDEERKRVEVMQHLQKAIADAGGGGK